MVSLSDIPCVGKVVDRISDATVDPIFRWFRYMFCTKDLAKALDSQVTKASIEEESVLTKVAAERANGKIIKDHVSKWQKEAEEIKESAKEFTERYNNRHSWRCIQRLPIPNPISRLRLGREAFQTTERLNELISSGKELLAKEIAHLAPVDNLPKSDSEFHNFESRQEAYRELWEALVNDSSQILGIYGMPGVGKTRMMEQIWKEAKEKKIFDKVTRGNVGSEKLDVIQLQKQIAGYLDCHFESQDNEESRASQLKQSLLNAGKILIILDDVWRKIPLDIIGIPCGDGTSSVGCKIFLTSRDEEVCLRNNCETPVKITPLSDDEAWEQFRNIVGTSRIQDEFLAKKVCKKCAGLPLLIHAVGKALEFRTSSTWEDALEQLEKGKFENITGIDPQVYACVKLSIDKLPDDAKSCLFLCCLFPEDSDIPIWQLIQLATGSQLVSDGEARVLSMVNTLRLSSLLLDCEYNNRTKLHDIIRDVGRWIAVRDPNYAFLMVRCGLRLPDVADFGSRKFLRLDLESDNVHFPDDLVCPDLHRLWLKCNNPIQKFSSGLFGMSANLRFLYVEGKYLCPKLQFSLQSWGKLKTLILNHCDLTHINKTNVGLFPEYLETLCIWYCVLPEPLDLSNLKYLRKLEIKLYGKVQIMPNTISSLSSLEELHIPYGFVIWGDGSAKIVKDDSSVVPKPILVEISQLTHLKSLRMYFERSEPFQDAHKLFDNLKLYNISVGAPCWDPPTFKKWIELHGGPTEGLESLIERAEDVKLWRSDTNVISSIFDSNREAFTDLRKLYIRECDNMEHVARMSQGEIQHNSQLKSFSKLTCLEIRKCSALRYLFCNSVAKFLAQLQELIIYDCPVMEAIVMNEGSTNEDIIINFSNLKKLTLGGVPRLRSFYMQKKDAIQSHPLFDSTVAFPSLEILQIRNLEEVSDIWESDYNNDKCGSSFCKLKNLYVGKCDRLETVIPVDMLHKLQNLKYLEITHCSSVISEVGTYASNTDACPLQALSHMHLKNLPCLTETWLNSRNPSTVMTMYPNLKKLEICKCDSLRNVFLLHSSFARDVMHLEEIIVKECEEIREIIGKGQEITDVVFPKLTHLRLMHLPTLIRCFGGEEANAIKVEFPNLVNLELGSCGEINLEAIEFSYQLESLKISCDNEIQLPCKWHPRLSNLETLILSRCWWHELKSECFQRLKTLQVEHLKCSTLFSFPVFTSLHTLDISRCALLEEIVEDIRSDEISGMNKKTITLLNLKYVTLRDLPKLKSFIYSANHECLMPELLIVSVSNCGFSSLFMCSAFGSLQRLEDLEVEDCRLLEGIFEYARGDETSDTNEQIITLSGLLFVKLKDLPNLKSFIHGANYDFNMPCLGNMEVDNCGFSTLFTCSAFKNLQRLWRLKVSNCRWLEGIVEDARGDETSITLPQLSSIKLEHLPKLKSFGQGYAFNMPKLEGDFHLLGCPVLEKFTSLDTKTGMVYVYTEGDEREEVSDVNDYIKQNFRRGSQLNDGAGELSHSEIVEEEKPRGSLGKGSQLNDGAGELSQSRRVRRFKARRRKG